MAAAPGNARAQYYLGLAYARIGIRQGAISHLREAVRLQPNAAMFHAALGRAYREAGDRDTQPVQRAHCHARYFNVSHLEVRA